MTKSHINPQAKNPGDPFTFLLVVTNSGGTPSGADTIRVMDVVPTGLTIGTITPASPFTCGVAGQVITCDNTLGALNAAASSTIGVSVTVAAGATNPLINAVKVGTNGTDPQNPTFPTNIEAALCTAVNVPIFGCAADSVPLNADLQIVKTQRQGIAGPFVAALANAVPTGSTVQFLVTISNAGPANVSSATIADTVPTNFSTVTWVCGLGSGTASCSAASGAGNAITLTGNLNSGSSLLITVTAVTRSASSVAGVTNTAAVTSPPGINDSTPGNNTASISTQIGVNNLSITKTDGITTVKAGTTTIYTVVVNNTGDYPADGARLFDPVAAGLQCTAPPTCTAAGPATSCPPGLTMAQLQNATAPTGVALGTFGAGGSLTFTFSCGVTATGQ